jgi:hypothetical protein
MAVEKKLVCPLFLWLTTLLDLVQIASLGPDRPALITLPELLVARVSLVGSGRADGFGRNYFLWRSDRSGKSCISDWSDRSVVSGMPDGLLDLFGLKGLTDVLGRGTVRVLVSLTGL